MSTVGIRHSEETREEVVRLYTKERMSIDRIANRKGMPTAKTIMRILDENGIERRSPVKFDRAAIRADIKRNPKASNMAIATRHRCSPRLVAMVRQSIGWKTRGEKPGRPRKYDRAAILDDLKNNPSDTMQTVAERWGCSPSLVSTIRNSLAKKTAPGQTKPVSSQRIRRPLEMVSSGDRSSDDRVRVKAKAPS